MAKVLADTMKKIALALFYIMIYFAMLFLLTMHTNLLEEDVENYSGIITILAILASLGIYKLSFYLRGINSEKYISIKRLTFLDVALSFTMAVGFRFLTGAYLMWSERNIPILEESIRNAQRSYNFNTMTIFGVFSIVLSVCIAAPLFEEVLFRGIVLYELRGVFPKYVAIILQALLFGISHAVLAQGVFATVYGIILGVIYCRTKNILVVITAHIFFNISSVLEVRNIEVLSQMAITGLILTVVSIYTFFYIYRGKKPVYAGDVTGGREDV